MNNQLVIIQLTNIWKELMETGDCNDAIRVLNEINILSVVDYLQYTNKLSDLDVDILEKLVYILQYIYNNDGMVNIIPDDRYDILHEKLKDYTGLNPIGSTTSINRKTVKHRYPDLRGTLDKVYWLKTKDRDDNRATLEEWMRSLENKLKSDIFKTGVPIILLPKWDGVSVILECDKDGVVEVALSRGDVETNEAVDLSYLFKGLQVPSEDQVSGPFAVKTEVVIHDDNFEKAKQTIFPFKTKRSAVSGMLNNQDLQRSTVLPLLSLKLLQIQEQGNRPLLHNFMFSDFGLFKGTTLSYDNLDNVGNCMKELREKILKSGFDFDGIVIRIMDDELQERLGRDNHINNYEVAFKFPAPEGKSILLDIEFQYGLLGAITPVAKIEPLFINGKTVSSISLGSMDRFESLGLCYGDEVIIKYDIIPYLVPYKNNGGKLVKAPTHCKYCEEELTKEPVLGCYNIDCVVNHVGQLLNYVTKMRIPNIGEAVIAEFVAKGILTDIPSLYRLRDHQNTIINMKGYGVKSYTNMLDAIDSRREVFDYELLGSLGIRSIGRKIFKRILNIYYIDELIQICVNGKLNKLIMEGIKEETARKILLGVKRNVETIEYLCSELTIKPYKDFRPAANENSIFVCFSKVRDKEFEKYLMSKGVVVSDSYNKKVDILICKDPNEESSKIKKAKKDGKEVISLTEAYQLFKFK